MKISKLIIKNFRSLRDVAFEPGGFNILVGRNNHGKSNLFEAIEWFYSGKGDLADLRYAGASEGEEMVVEIEFSGVQTGLEQISNKDNQQKLRNIVGEDDVLSVRRTSVDSKARYVYNAKEGKWQKQPVGVDSAFNNCIPRFEFVLTDKNLKEVSAFKATTPIGQMLSSVVSEALEQDPRYVDFKQKFAELFESPDSNVRRLLQQTSERVAGHLKLQFPDCAAVEFNVEIPPFEDFLKGYTTTVDDGVTTLAEEKGDGMQRALMLAIIKAHADARRHEALGKAFIFFIDEAELHLHPAAQRQLKNALASLTEDVDQVFITTHSSVFLSDTHAGQAEFVVEKEDGATSVTPMTKKERVRTVYELLGGNPTDLLLPANFLVVEGPSEVLFIEAVCARYYLEKPKIHVVAANGDDERQAQYLAALMKCYAPLKDSPVYRRCAVLLFDAPTGGDKQARLTAFLEQNADIRDNNRAHTLPTTGLEDYYPAEVRAKYPNLTNKIKLARAIGAEITQNQFEQDMPVIFAALTACWEKAYQA
ncbi:ATP-binding protein [Acidovorax sp. ACV02]|uniref:ATP-dependent nuclease n=1 Tax=Acidovorax sp. ACV02 TaxID=2769310 RepID=UPI0017875C06|nr:AAA family ATPase [Acidovorax sp. ACV02]MBD9407200.1 ATP-binding protein [Acidovorax sp. ACV02]